MDNATKWANIKSMRNHLLCNTDWCVLPDSPLSAELLDAVKIYRQKLRDITKDFENPDDVIFPDNPLIGG
jgi:hypothetical protein